LLFSFVKFQVKLINYNGMNSRSAVILFIFISRGTATQLKRGGRPCNGYIDSFLGDLTVKELCKIGLDEVVIKIQVIIVF